MPNTKPFLSQRIIATIIDYGIYYMFFFLYISIFGEENGDGGKSVSGLPGFIPIIIWFLYFVLAETFASATLGHQLFNLQVRSLDGSKIDFTQALRRRLLDLIDINFLGIPAVIAIKNTDKNQRLGDLWAGTMMFKTDQ